MEQVVKVPVEPPSESESESESEDEPIPEPAKEKSTKSRPIAIKEARAATPKTIEKE